MTRSGPLPRHVLVLGVSGSGKSTIAARVAALTGRTFADGDDFHPARNVDLMTRGIPLTDADRAPWLASMRDWLLARQAGPGTVLACSALKAAYRDVLAEAGGVAFVLLDVPREELAARLGARPGHFMPASLLDSQLATLERPGPGQALVLDASQPPEAVARAVVDGLGLGRA